VAIPFRLAWISLPDNNPPGALTPMNHSGKIAYADCFSGISGDMLLGALLHAGLDENLLRAELQKLGLKDLVLEITSSSRQSISCKHVAISQVRRQDLRTLPAIIKILDQSDLDPTICKKSAAIFKVLAEAEAKVHGISIDDVHFHEIGALDTIIDIVGAVIGFHHLGITKLISSPLPLGNGFVHCAHGKLPLPAPAVCELLQGVPSYGVDIQQELVTPTGAALISALADEFGSMPPMTINATGYGAGSHILPNNQPNLLRLLVGTPRETIEAQTVIVIETRMDDWNPEGFQHLCDLLLSSGALDVSLSTCQGKKGRPGFNLQVICNPANSDILQNVLLSETTAIGLRYREERRKTLAREIITVPTPWGNILAKKVATPRGPVIYPEYEECRRTATEHKISLDEVYRAVYRFKEEH
jgi:uncharacterized protein (TIGR00299 family) protein